MNRRRFLQATAASTVAAPAFASAASTSAPILAGIQVAPFSFFHEGIGPALDFMQETAGINAVFVYSQTYHLGDYHDNVFATDHPAPPFAASKHKLPRQWVRLPAEPFKKLPIQHQDPDVGAFAGRDLFKELVEPCRQRGIKLYARILEAGFGKERNPPGYESVATVDLFGEPSHGPCWNHPGYRDWIRTTIEQTMKIYPLHGLQYGAERVGPLSEVLFRGDVPACFCEHCVARNAARGIDAERAKEGYRQLYRLIQDTRQHKPRPADGLVTSVLRVFFHFPEVLAWYREWFAADTEIQTMVYQTAKEIQPDADVGQHIDHQRSSWDPFYRAIVPYSALAEHNDFIKPIVYHDVSGPRLKEWVIERNHQHVFNEIDPELALQLFYALFDHQDEPGLAALATTGLSPEYVYKETRRAVTGVDGKAKIYAGIGLDVPLYVPGGKAPMISDPDHVTDATRRALDAGAAGVLASREYEEMTRSSLEAFGRGLS